MHLVPQAGKKEGDDSTVSGESWTVGSDLMDRGNEGQVYRHKVSCFCWRSHEHRIDLHEPRLQLLDQIMNALIRP